MPTYDFHTLSDADFAELVRDLLSESLGTRFQSFTQGPDGGIDLLSGPSQSDGIIVQCKHFSGSGFSKLRAKLAAIELPKVRRLRPQHYIIATSVGLTPGNKSDLLELFTPYCSRLDDIYGRDDLNGLLRDHPAVERSHYKLWLTSVPVLQQVLHQDRLTWNALTQDEIERKLSRYVQTRAYDAAMKVLEQHNYCILSGIPGIGKTTLAQVMVARLLQDGFELIAVSDDVREAFDLLDPTRRQVVYYDDFLGRSSLEERLGKNEDKRLLSLLNKAARSAQLKVILTTREYILADAQRLHEQLNARQIEIGKCIVRIEDYSRVDRARILYNHVYFSSLPTEYAATLLRDRAYIKIVDHRNYTPRIIEWMTGNAKVPAIPPEEFVKEFVGALDNPLEIWKHAFENQITADERAVLFTLASVAGTIDFDDLRRVWAAFRKLPDGSQCQDGRERFSTAIKHLEGSFIRTERGRMAIGVSFHNASINDYVMRHLGADRNLVNELISCSLYFEQLSHLIRLDPDGHIGRHPPPGVSRTEAMEATMARTVLVPSPNLSSAVVGWRGELKFYHTSADCGARLSQAVGWATTLGSGWYEVICRAANEAALGGSISKVATPGAIGFLDAVLGRWPPDGGTWSSLVQDFIAVMADRFADGDGSVDEWLEWTGFLQAHKGLFSPVRLDAQAQAASDFCEAEVDVIRDNADSHEQVDGWFDSLEELAEKWDVELAGQRDRVHEAVDERFQGRAAHDPDHEWKSATTKAPTRDDGGGTDEEIDVLFRSLAERSSS